MTRRQPEHSLLMRIIYAALREVAGLFRLKWYGSRPGVAEPCRRCRTGGEIDLSSGLVSRDGNANSISCWGCGGMGYVYRTYGPT